MSLRFPFFKAPIKLGMQELPYSDFIDGFTLQVLFFSQRPQYFRRKIQRIQLNIMFMSLISLGIFVITNGGISLIGWFLLTQLLLNHQKNWVVQLAFLGGRFLLSGFLDGYITQVLLNHLWMFFKKITPP